MMVKLLETNNETKKKKGYDPDQYITLFTPAEICDKVGCHPRTWARWCKSLGIKSRGLGKTPLYAVDSVYTVLHVVYGDTEGQRLMDLFCSK